MTIQQFFGNPKFLLYTRLLRRLHKLIRGGMDETDEGESLRNQMDEPGEYLTPEEVDCASAFSADFYTLTGPPMEPKSNPPSGLRDDLRKALDARDSRDFRKALELVRKNQAYLEPALVAYIRGSTWSGAGENEIAVEFFERAKELAPQNAGYAYVWLDALSRADIAEALEIAKRVILQRADHPPQLILKAAEVLFSSRRQLSGADAVAATRSLIPAFEDVMVRLETSGELQASPSLLVSVIGLLGLCKMEIGESDAAKQLFDKGLRLFPNAEVLLIARGMNFYVLDPDDSLRSFKRAIQLGSRLTWPYFFLAHYYLVHSQYEQCLEMAQHALRLAPSEAVRADCLEWIAISQANLGYPPESVRAVFLVAHQLAPDNRRIAKNLQLFDESLVGASSSEIRWEQLESEAVKSLGQREFQSVS